MVNKLSENNLKFFDDIFKSTNKVHRLDYTFIPFYNKVCKRIKTNCRSCHNMDQKTVSAYVAYIAFYTEKALKYHELIFEYCLNDNLDGYIYTMDERYEPILLNLIKKIIRTLNKLKEEPKNGELMYKILYRLYMEKEDIRVVLKKLNLSNSQFYRLKKKGLILMAYYLWDYYMSNRNEKLHCLRNWSYCVGC